MKADFYGGKATVEAFFDFRDNFKIMFLNRSVEFF